MVKSFFYKAYGLVIASAIKLSLPLTSLKHAKVNIYSQEIDAFPEGKVVLDKPNSLVLIRYSPKDIGVLLNNKPFFRVINGDEIIVNSHLDIKHELLNSLIINQGMGILLYQKGYLVLHGSAVNMNGRGVAFLGESRMGKSTIASILNLNGYEFITDDVLAIRFDDNKPFIFPSFQIVKLREEVIITLTKMFPHIQRYSKYNNLFETSNFSNDPIPLKSIYVLKKDDKIGTINLTPMKALLELLKQSYASVLFTNEEKLANMLQCNKVVKKVSVKYLKRGRSIQKHPSLINAIENNEIN